MRTNKFTTIIYKLKEEWQDFQVVFTDNTFGKLLNVEGKRYLQFIYTFRKKTTLRVAQFS